MRELKDSGVEWIGEIPKSWELAKAKYCIYIHNGSDPKTEGDIHVYGSGTASFKTCGEFKNGPTVLLGRKGSIDTPHYIEGKYWNVDTAFDTEAKHNIDLKYYFYLASSFDYKYYMSQTTLPSMTQSNYENMIIPLPSLKMQRNIVAFLDNKCAEVDAITSDIESQIDTLEQYKRSIITEAVTKGLNPSVEMKDSGVEWIGKIPKDWELMKITYIADSRYPYSLGDGDHGLMKTDDYIDDGIPYIRVQNIGWCTDLQLDNVVYISEENNKRIKNSTLKPGDILFVKTGATIGKTGIVPDNIKIANTTSHVAKLTVSEKYNSKYILYFLSSQIGYKQMWDIASQKTTRPELSIDEIKTMKVIAPSSKDEQDTIVDYLDDKCSDIDAVISDKQTQHEILTEYKKSLIYEYVTGKKDVSVG